jgi:hypothetical protein
MSSNLLWEPRKQNYRELSTELKFAMRKGFGDPIDIELNENSIGYLTGLVHAGIEDAQNLIDAIQKWGVVRVWEDHG